MSRQREYIPSRMGSIDANGKRVLPEDFTPESMLDRTPEQKCNDDLSLWVIVKCCDGAYAHCEGVGTLEQIEARHKTGSDADLQFIRQTTHLRNALEHGILPGDEESSGGKRM